MMEKKSRDFFSKADDKLRKQVIINWYVIIGIVFLTFIVFAPLVYSYGHYEGYNKKSFELEQEADEKLSQDLMSLEVGEVWDIFLKNLMIKTMFWLPWIMIALLLGWVLHGIL